MIINSYIYGVGYDPDAQLFITATGISGTNATATNQLVIDLKAANIWTKFKAIYPVVGGTATAHKFNLKNPLDTNAAFRLVFSGGWTHSSTGMLSNGTNAFADTFLAPNVMALNSIHGSVYLQQDNGINGAAFGSEVASTFANGFYLFPKQITPFNCSVRINDNTSQNTVMGNIKGLNLITRTASNVKKYKVNTTDIFSVTTVSSAAHTDSIHIGKTRNNALYYLNLYSFASFGDGLSDLESQLFYQITEKYQVALSRNVNTLQSFYYNSAYNNETNAFLFSTQITDNTIQTATDTLVTDLKTAGVFTKMKALYPMVGGTATTCKFNLVNSQDTNAAYRLVFNGGGTFSANGYQPNGTNAYANTFFTPLTSLTLNSAHISYYSRTNTSAYMVEMGNYDAVTLSSTLLLLRNVNTATIRMNNLTNIDYSNTDSLGLHISNRTASNVITGWKNGIKKITSAVASTVLPANPIYIGAFRDGNLPNYYSSKECAFASIGDGLTDAEALAFYNAVQTFNTTLARQV